MIDPALFMTDELHMWTNPDRGERLEVIRSHFTADVEFHDAVMLLAKSQLAR